MEEGKKKNGEYVGVDEKYIPEDEKYVDESLLGNKEESKRKIKKIAKGVGIGYIVYVCLIVIISLVVFITVFKFMGSIFKQTQSQVDKQYIDIEQQIEETKDKYENMQNQINNQIQEWETNSKINTHNNTLQNLYTGSQKGINIKNALKKVIEINQQDDVKITVVYNGTSTQDASQIGNISNSFEDFNDYLITYDYNSDGYIVTMNISNV